MSINSAQLKTRLKNLKAPSRPWRSNCSEKIGINAEVKAPSPSIRLNKLGKVKANKNAELSDEAPKRVNNAISRNSPVIREPIVDVETIIIFLKSFTTRPYILIMIGPILMQCHECSQHKEN